MTSKIRYKNREVNKLVLKILLLEIPCKKDLKKSYTLEENICKPYTKQRTSTYKTLKTQQQTQQQTPTIHTQLENGQKT